MKSVKKLLLCLILLIILAELSIVFQCLSASLAEPIFTKSLGGMVQPMGIDHKNQNKGFSL
ncbi:hypothetical protein BJL90_04980 [Clostridium formicaceticum]|uniref:Uncharacterized protein n=1 Tax=Clostridium formicaceticum TaxID=1497 RepID=A0ABN4T2U8_9CLOT|nr:hypothetical protein BJL90_04980 [Clostridium formicaceticum]